MIRPLVAAVALAIAAPASAVTVAFVGTQMNDTPPPISNSPLCGPGQLLIAFSPENAISTGSSNFGDFASSQQHCLTPPPVSYEGGVFDYTFAAGDMFFGTYSGFFTPSEIEGVLNNTLNLVVTGGTGRFLGATGTLTGIGTLDRRVPRPISLLSVNGTLDLLAVPEPAAWAMMITGFGLVGAGARRRRSSVCGSASKRHPGHL